MRVRSASTGSSSTRRILLTGRSLIYDFVRAQQHRARYRDAERTGSLHVDRELELRRQPDRQIAGLRALENLVDVPGRAPEQIRDVGAIAQQAAELGEERRGVHR